MASVTFSVSVGGDGSTVTDDANATTGLANGGHRTRFVPALSQTVAVASNTVTQATNASSSATLASQWASTTGSLIAATDYSSKEYAIGTVATVGSAKSWATVTGALVGGTDYSAKEWSIGTTVPDGSAKSWAQTALNAPGTSATSTSSIAIGTGSKSLTLAQTGKSFVLGQYVQIVSTASTQNWMVGAITAFTAGTGAMTVNVTHTGGSGTIAAWAITPAAPPNLPSQSGQSGKYLTTNGSVASWDYTPSNDMALMALGIV